MKKISTFLLFAFMLVQVFDSYSQTITIKAGLNLANMSSKDSYGKFDSKAITGFNLGATAEFPLTEMFSFETGLQLSTKGAKGTYVDQEMSVSYEEKYKLTYLDIPLTAKASINTGGVKFYGLLGPYLGFGLGGQYYEAGEGTTIKWGSDANNDDFKRLDYGLAIGAGVEINAIQIGLTYELGLVNISSNTADGMSVHNNVLGVSVGYKFGKK